METVDQALAFHVSHVSSRVPMLHGHFPRSFSAIFSCRATFRNRKHKVSRLPPWQALAVAHIFSLRSLTDPG